MKNIDVTYNTDGYIADMTDNSIHFEQENHSLQINAAIWTDKKVRAYIKAPNNNSTITDELTPEDGVYSYVAEDKYMAKGTLYVGFELYDDDGYIERLEPLKIYIDSFVSPGAGNSDNVYVVTVSVGNVQTVPFEQDAEVENTGTKKDMILDFKIPRGEKGDKGNDGYTPVKGVDYFTDKEIADMEFKIKNPAKQLIDYEIGTISASGILTTDSKNRFVRSVGYLGADNILSISSFTDYVVYVYLYQEDAFVKRIKLVSNYYIDDSYNYKLIAKYSDDRTLTDEDIAQMTNDIILERVPTTEDVAKNSLVGIDTANSWWCTPRTAYNKVRDNMYVTGIDREGLQKINIFNLRNKVVKTVRLSYFSKDDHNTPSLQFTDSSGSNIPLVAYTGHANHNYVCFRKGAAPYDVESLETAEERHISFDNGTDNKCTYASLIKLNPTKRVMLVTRLGSELWYSISEDWGDTWSEAKLFVKGLYYMTYRHGDSANIHFAFASHPTETGTTDIRYMKLNVVSGDMYDATDTVIANLYSEEFAGISIKTEGGTNTILADSEYGTRVLDISPLGDLLCCEIDMENPQNGGMIYKLTKSDSTWSRKDLVHSGVPIGYYPSAYIGGACFDNFTGSVIGCYICREYNGEWITEHRKYNFNTHDFNVDRVIEKGIYKMGRPQISYALSRSENAEKNVFTYLRYQQYAEDTYTDYFADQIVVRTDI